MKKYIVICFAIHERKIASYNSFEKEEDANIFVKRDAENVYAEEVNNECNNEVDLVFNDDVPAYVSSFDKEYEWTWEIIEIK